MLDTPLWTRSPARAAAVSLAPATAKLTSIGGGRHLLELSGRLALGWMGRLAAALAERRVSVVSARARQSAPRLWVAAFEIEPLDPGVALDSLDWVAFAALAPGRAVGVEPRLGSFRLERTGDALQVEIHAQDQLGFLDGILRTFAACSLFPEEMLVETRGAEVLDTFVLRGIGGSMPPRAISEALQARLARLTRADGRGALSGRAKTSR